jgi:hypothetical protein
MGVSINRLSKFLLLVLFLSCFRFLAHAEPQGSKEEAQAIVFETGKPAGSEADVMKWAADANKRLFNHMGPKDWTAKQKVDFYDAGMEMIREASRPFLALPYGAFAVANDAYYLRMGEKGFFVVIEKRTGQVSNGRIDKAKYLEGTGVDEKVSPAKRIATNLPATAEQLAALPGVSMTSIPLPVPPAAMRAPTSSEAEYCATGWAKAH